MADPGALTASTISMGQTFVAYQWLLPSLAEVRKAPSDDPAMRGDVLIGQVAAGALSITVGVMLAWLTNSPIPVWTALFVAFVIGSTYQYALTKGSS